MIHFEWPWLWCLLPLPWIIRQLSKAPTLAEAALNVPFLPTTQQTSQERSKKALIPPFIVYLIWLLLVCAVTRPQWLGDAVNVPSEGREMMIAVDLSGSMQVEDMELSGRQVNRLQMLKSVLGDFIERRAGDRLGLILFADDAYLQTPMTYDRDTVKQMLDEAVLGLVGQQTAIGDAIGLAAKRFDQKPETNRVLVLLTDGQNTAGNITPEQALELAKAKGVTIYTIGIGADVMLQRSLFSTRRINPSSELDEDMLTNLANSTGGKYFRARDTQGMMDIYQLLDQLEPIKQDQQQMRPLTSLFYWPLAVALIISFLQTLVMFRSITKPKVSAL